MRGRDYFKIARPFLRVVTGVLYLVPRNIVASIWVLLDIFPGKIGVGLRYSFASRMIEGLGSNVFFGRGVEVIGWENLKIGDNVSIHKDCYIDASGGIAIGNDVSIAHASSVLTFEHTWGVKDVPIRSNPSIFAPVTISDDVWIGCGCRILSGVTIGSRSVVAAGAVVTKDMPAGVLVGGVPSKFIKSIV